MKLCIFQNFISLFHLLAVDPNDIDRASVATDDEAIEQELKKSKAEKGEKKSKKQLAKEKAALKEARRQEKQVSYSKGGKNSIDCEFHIHDNNN